MPDTPTRRRPTDAPAVGEPALPDGALEVLRALESAGHETWAVGGFVRDALLGRPAADVDLATSALWRQAQGVFEARGWATRETGVAHGTLTVVVDGAGFEVTTFRTDGSYADARHPDSVSFVSTVEEDLARRDFTCNAMAWHPERGLLDPYGGLDDLRRGTIRAVGSPTQRFSEDALRVLRACRFAAELGFSIEPGTWQGMLANKKLVYTLPKERVLAELDRFVTGRYAGQALLDTVDALSAVLPELAAMKGFEQHSPFHIYDVLEHTACVLDASPRTRLARWAALFHDMSKPAAFFTDEDGVGHFHGHPILSAQMAAGAMERLGMPRRLCEQVLALVRRHDEHIAPDARSVRRMLAQLGGDVELTRALFELQRADAIGHAPFFAAQRLEVVEEQLRLLDEIVAAEGVPTVGNLAVGGRELMAAGIPEGPLVGLALDAALDAVVEERVANEPDALLAFVQDWFADGAGGKMR